MRTITRLLFATTLVTLFFLAPAVGDESETRIALLSGEAYRGIRIVAVSGTTLTFETADGRSKATDLDKLVGVSFRDARPSSGPPGRRDVEVRFRGGDVLRGTLLPGEDEEISIESPLVGDLAFPVDEVREIRFARAWREAVEKPAPETGEQDLDVFYYGNLDRVSGTFLRVTSGHIHIHGRGQNSDLPVAFENLMAIRFADFPAPEKTRERLAILLLVDGSRLTVKNLTSAGTSLRAVTERGRPLEVEMSALVAIYMQGGGFEYLSDLKPAASEIVPWLGEAHAWDRPRFDRSFLDGPLRSGGQTFLKGIGVISGTSLTWALDGEFKRFTSRIALDDRAGAEGDVVFEVFVDGKSRFKSKTVGALEPGDAPYRIEPIDIEGAREIKLTVRYVDDFVRDFANWIEPMLIR